MVVPVYNSEDQLGALVAALAETLEHAVRSHADEEIEVVLVNDGSSDASWQQIITLGERHGWIRGLDLADNVGQHAALIAGASVASGGVIVTMDDDLQHPPAKIRCLVAELRYQASMSGGEVGLIYGTPLSRGPLGFRRAGSFLARLGLACRLRSLVALRSSAFRAFDARHVTALSEFDQRSINLDAALAALGVRASYVLTAHGASLRSSSRYGIRSLIRAAGAVFKGPREGRLPRECHRNSRSDDAVTD
ncbi:MAG: glycosyltransferase [Planctomycetota bacterium]